MKQAIIGLTALLLGALAGCSSPTTSTAPMSTHRLSAAATPTAPSRTAKACQSLATIRTSIASLATQAQSITVGQVKAAQQRIAAAGTKLETTLPSDDVPAVTNIKDANTNLTNAVSGYPDNTPMSKVLPAQPAYQNYVAQVQAAQGQLSAKLGCSA